jgi:hypothetical protein
VMQLQQRKRRGKRDRVEFDSAIAQTGAWSVRYAGSWTLDLLRRAHVSPML